MKTLSIDKIYIADSVRQQTERYKKAAEKFQDIFGEKPSAAFSAPGRTEIGGNHTDHNFGCVIAAGVSLDVIGMVKPTDDGIIELKSEGFDKLTVDTADLNARAEEENTSAALIRGTAAGFAEKGYKVGGFKAYCTSNVLQGSGLSSSAAFEVLIGTVLNGLYNGGKVDDVEIAKISQYAENVYFGKPSGLMDQTACSVGGFITIDFKDEQNPIVKSVNYDFASSGYRLCIVDTKGSHADLTGEYGAIPQEMKSVAKFFGKEVLREISKADVLGDLSAVRAKCGDRAVLRALHFFDDSQRAAEEANALENGNFDEFLRLVNSSGESSLAYLQNIFPCSAPQNQGVTLALYAAKSLLNGRGAVRVHGGGFAGTIQAFVPESETAVFKCGMEKVFGEGSCYVLSIRPCGGTKIDLEVL